MHESDELSAIARRQLELAAPELDDDTPGVGAVRERLAAYEQDEGADTGRALTDALRKLHGRIRTEFNAAVLIQAGHDVKMAKRGVREIEAFLGTQP